MDLQSLTDEEVFGRWLAAGNELRRRGVVRTGNVRGDYAEMLVAQRLGLTLTTNSKAGHDAIAEDGTRYQIKARQLGGIGDRQLGVIRNIGQRDFEYLVAVLFPKDSVLPAEMWCLPFDFVCEKARYNKHQNGHVLHATGSVLADPRVDWLLETPRPGLMLRLPPAGEGRPRGSRGGKAKGTRATESFRSWLTDEKRYSDNVVANVLSRCRRVERDLAVNLNASVRTELGLAGIIDRIREELLTNASGKSRREGQASLISATRRYAEFLAANPRTDLGDSIV